MTNREKKLELRIILLEEASQVVFQAFIEAGKRFENADCCGRTALAIARHPRVSERCCNGKNVVNPAADQHYAALT